MKQSLKKVLIVTYYWPPAGGSGVQRWLMFAKYLRDFGWEPVIYTAENPEVPHFDHSLLAEVPSGLEVIRGPIWEPFDVYRSLTGRKKDEPVSMVVDLKKKKSVAQRLSLWVRSNLFIPDAKKFWIRPSVKLLQQRISQGDIAVLVTTGPPHSCHRIGFYLKKKFPKLPWLADFRDPWTQIDFFKELDLTNRALAKHRLKEKEVLSGADKVVVIGPHMARSFESIVNRDYQVIFNGYDGSSQSEEQALDQEFSLVHIGIYSKSRNHPSLLRAIQVLGESNDVFKDKFKLIFVGQVDESVKRQVTAFGLQKMVEYRDFVPHGQVSKIQQSARMLYLSINNVEGCQGVLTGKLFEYIQTDRPILLIGPRDGDAAQLAGDLQGVDVVEFEAQAQIQEVLLAQFELYLSGKDSRFSRDTSAYTRAALTKKLATALDQLALN